MKPIEFENGEVQIDAAIVAEGLGVTLPLLQQGMRAGSITSLAERGVDADLGRHRLTFFSEHRRFRVVVDAAMHRCRNRCVSPADETARRLGLERRCRKGRYLHRRSNDLWLRG